MDFLIFSLRNVQVFLPVFIGLFTCLLLRPGFLFLKLYCEYNFFSVTYIVYKYFLLDIFFIVFDEWGFLNFINSSLLMFYFTVHAFYVFSKKSSLTQKYENRLIFSSILSLLILSLGLWFISTWFCVNCEIWLKNSCCLFNLFSSSSHSSSHLPFSSTMHSPHLRSGELGSLSLRTEHLQELFKIIKNCYSLSFKN